MTLIAVFLTLGFGISSFIAVTYYLDYEDLKLENEELIETIEFRAKEMMRKLESQKVTVVVDNFNL